jgi:D-alanyl-D-alanine carboxypeptidase/D-alanyl-D-alanine-endopeptidase (penicillin-binding protein 4)
MIVIVLLSVLSIDSILNQPELVTAQYGICVADLADDRIVYARNAKRLFIPASNMKIITIATALTFLDPDFRFKTLLATTGSRAASTLNGDIVIVGGGDPTLALTDLESFVAAIVSKEVNTVAGNIVAVSSSFEDVVPMESSFRYERLPVGWAWHYLDARYAAEVSALSVNGNTVNVRMKATQRGERADVSVEPATTYVTLVSDMVTKAGDDSIIIYRLWDSNTIYVSGGIGNARERDIDVAIRNPALFAAYYVKELLEKAGIDVRGEVINISSAAQAAHVLENRTIIDSALSEPLIDILPEISIESDNLYSEMLLKTLGLQYYREGSFAAGVRVLKRLLYLAGVDTSGVSLWDGSGLSRHDLVSPYVLVLVLRYMHNSEHSSTFYELLPGSGEGTLERRFRGFDASMHAKTGTLYAVSCLSGYITVNHRDYCFAMMFNNFTCPRQKIEHIQEEILTALAEHLAK